MCRLADCTKYDPSNLSFFDRSRECSRTVLGERHNSSSDDGMSHRPTRCASGWDNAPCTPRSTQVEFHCSVPMTFAAGSQLAKTPGCPPTRVSEIAEGLGREPSVTTFGDRGSVRRGTSSGIISRLFAPYRDFRIPSFPFLGTTPSRHLRRCVEIMRENGRSGEI